MKHAYLLIFFLLVLTASSSAQDFDYGKITGSDFELKNTVLDSNANAMVIREFGTSSMQLDDVTRSLSSKSLIKMALEAATSLFPEEYTEMGRMKYLSLLPRRPIW
jgi:hypothetical protein